ncbi:DUF6519 domain-containing protein, partial [Streptomyces sp. NPDC059900]|uniref:DUF6519 domain-containing protein n=1 Tax=Streptomyces sp. NPDC059900 TaxID=3155816 RepID=UPI003D01F3B7
IEVTSPDGVELRLSAGHLYADGILVVNETDVPYDKQPDRIGAKVAWPPGDGWYAVFLDVWRRLVTARDDPSIREVALGGPTTSARERTVWQARHAPVSPDWTCEKGLKPPPDTTGLMAARATPEAAATRPCLVPPLAGYTGLENQLYRVEVLTSGAALDISAGSRLLPVVSIPPGTTREVELSAADAATLAVGAVVELVATAPDSKPLDATFAQVAAISPGSGIVTLTGQVPEIDAAAAPALRPAEAAVVVSRENGSVVTGVTRIDGAEVTVADIGPDDVLGFAPGQWVELTDDAIELEGPARLLRQVTSVDRGRRTITLGIEVPRLSAHQDGVDADRHPKLRRWDTARAVAFHPDGTSWIHLENGIEVRFTAGHYESGDFWHFPARTAVVDPDSGTIEWPHDESEAPAEIAPAGVEHHYCLLARVRVKTGQGNVPQTTVVDDCRNLFPPLTALTNLLYVGGDGQEARRGAPAFPQVPAPLAVRVVNGALPVAGARVRFSVTEGQGRLGHAEPTTDGNGLAQTAWDLDPTTPAQTVEAHLLDHAGGEIGHQVVTFHATVDDEHGCCVCVGPGEEFPTLDSALRALLDQGAHVLCLCLAPGIHHVQEVLLAADPTGPPLHLSVHGCGRGTKVRVQGDWRIDGWASFRLRDLDVQFVRDHGLTTQAVDDVELENVHVTGVLAQGSLVRIHDARGVSVIGCDLRPRTLKGLRRLSELLKGFGPLEQLWLEDDERFEDALRGAATELHQAKEDTRTEMANDLHRLAADGRRRLPGSLAIRLTHLAEILAKNVTVAGLTGVLRLLPAAYGGVEPAVALEVGTRDDFQKEIGRPAFVREARIVVARNEIAGDLSFYGRPDQDRLTPEERTALSDWIRDGALKRAVAGSVDVRENHLLRLLVSSGMIRAVREASTNKTLLVTTYNTFHVTGNVIDGQDGQILARQVNVAGNNFTVDAVPAPPTTVPPATVVIADSAILSANHGVLVPFPKAGDFPIEIHQIARVMAEGLNLDLQIL